MARTLKMEEAVIKKQSVIGGNGYVQGAGAGWEEMLQARVTLI